jgi:hypothetical protein
MKKLGPESLPPWKRKRPTGAKRPLTPDQRAAARARAAAAGRRYPNLVDNMWAARHVAAGSAAAGSGPSSGEEE